MKAQKQPGKLEATASILDNLTTIILTLIGLAIFIAVIFFFINLQTKSDDSSMSIEEAQEKCMLMEEADLVNTMGEEFGPATTKKAERFCLSAWDTSEKEATFKEDVKIDWENRKTEILEGYTLEELYNETHSNA